MHTNKTYRPFLNFAIVKFLYDFELDQKERKLKVDKVTGGNLIPKLHATFHVRAIILRAL